MKNKIIIISSPSGAGKTTICKKLMKKIQEIELSISYTTRPIRNKEKEGIDYFFTTKKASINFKFLTTTVFTHQGFPLQG